MLYPPPCLRPNCLHPFSFIMYTNCVKRRTSLHSIPVTFTHSPVRIRVYTLFWIAYMHTEFTAQHLNYNLINNYCPERKNWTKLTSKCRQSIDYTQNNNIEFYSKFRLNVRWFRIVVDNVQYQLNNPPQTQYKEKVNEYFYVLRFACRM